MDIKPLSAATERSEEIDILKFVHQSQKAESLQHRQTIFNTFAVWTATLLAMIGAVLATNPPYLLNEWCGKLSASMVISFLTILVIVFIWQQRTLAAEGLNIARRIEQRLGLFEKGRYFGDKDETVLPDRFAKPVKETATTSDKFQMLLIAILTVFFCIAIVTNNPPQPEDPGAGEYETPQNLSTGV